MMRREGAAGSDPQGNGPAWSGTAVPRLTIAALALLIAGLGVVSSISRPGRRRPASRPGAPTPLKSVDLDRYLGRWHQFARYDGWFARRDENVTMDYARRPDGLIRVVSSSSSAGGERRPRRREARARAVAGSGNAKFRLAVFGPFFLGHHWVLDHGEDYGWAIVGEGSGRALWILTRVPAPAPDIQEMLFSRARALGYDTDRLRRTRQAEA